MNNVTRAEWFAIVGLALSLSTAAFTGGVVWSEVQDHETRIAKQETKLDELIPKVERIDANVAFLAERAREDRERSK